RSLCVYKALMIIQSHFLRHRQDQTGRMLQMGLLWITAALLSSPLLTLCDPLYVLSAPQILKVGTEDRVFVEVQDYKGQNPVRVAIRVMNFPSQDRDLFSKIVTLKPDESFQALVDINILGDVFDRDTKKQHYVYLKATFDDPNGPQSMEKIVMVSFQSGYIFIQTDKTIYTPDSTVRYRTFPLDAEAKAIERPFLVDVVTPEGIVIKSDQYAQQRSLEYKLPNPVSPGVWKIVASFKDSPDKNFTAEFEVKEYVLPSFEVSLTPDKPFFLLDCETYSVDIKAKYLFGQAVEGTAFAVFGIYHKGEKMSLRSSLAREPIVKGIGKAKLEKEHILSTFPNIEELVGSTLYISVSILTESGSEMVEAERRGIPIVKAPYTIHFTRTPKFFKPGMPFDCRVYVTNPDETPASDIEIQVTDDPENHKAKTNKNGIAKFVINTKKEASTLDITVRTVQENLSEASKMTAHAYKPKEGSQNYLHIDITTGLLTVGNQLSLKLNRGSESGDQDFTVMVLSKGRIIKTLRHQKSSSSVIAVPLDVTKEMLPSFRVVAYYHVGADEVVADSIWVDVEDTCMGSLSVTVDDEKAAYNPRSSIKLKITGDPGSKVGLVAVDKGVYVLNNKNRLTQNKSRISGHRTLPTGGCLTGRCPTGRCLTGCCPTGRCPTGRCPTGRCPTGRCPTGRCLTGRCLTGRCPQDAAPQDAAHRTLLAGKFWQIWDTVEMHDLACTAGSGKDSMGVFYDAGLLFMSNSGGSSPDRRVDGYSENLKRCCLDGVVENFLGYTCERRAEYIQDGDECREAFLNCCAKLAKVKGESLQEELHFSRSEEEEDDDEMFDEDTTRSYFPESWMWMDVELPDCKEKKECANATEQRFPESITTWVITAVSISKDYGICVAEPKSIIVKKPLFIDLKLPYSAVVNEQIEIKAIIHNLDDDPIKKAIVDLVETDTVCSLASYKKKYRTIVNIAATSSRAVPFVIIPLDPGQHDIEVKVRNPDGGSDGVRKKLNVVTQGVLKSTGEQTLILEPLKHGGSQRELFKRPLLENQMPGTEAYTYIAVRGKPISQLVNEAISGRGLDSLIKVPSGCGEQNLMAMVLPLIATHYLDRTNQWEDIGVDKRTEALGHITTGYTTELKYHKEDGSFAVYPSNKGSTWLTAYVVKMFSMASNLVRIDPKVICSAIKWLTLNAQMPDGVFREVTQIYSSAMWGKSSQLSMTAFVLIALQEGSPQCLDKVGNLQQNMDRAAEFIVSDIASESDPYAVAMASYALARAGRLDLNALLRSASPDGTHWPVKGDHLFTLEATGYAVLALLTTKKLEKAAPAVRWLKTNQRHTGGYHSTQATAVVFEAIARYMMERPPPSVGSMNVTVTSTERASIFKGLFTRKTRGLQRSDRFKAKGDLIVEAGGQGEGSISVVTLYYARPADNSTKCKNFDLDVKFIRNRTTSYDGALASYTLSIETKFLSSDKEASMTILDISLLTGFVPDTGDLQKLMGTDRYIQKFEMDKQLSERGSLLIYLNKVTEINIKRLEQITIQVLSQYTQASVQVLSQYTQASVQVLSQYTQASVQVLSQYTQASVQVLSQYTQASVQVLSQYTQASVQVLSQYTQASVQVLSQYTQASVQVLSQYTQASVQVLSQYTQASVQVLSQYTQASVQVLSQYTRASVQVLSQYTRASVQVLSQYTQASVQVLSQYTQASVQVLSQYTQASVQVLSQYTQASVQVLSQYTQASVQVLSQYTQASVQVLSQYTQASVQVLSQYTQASVQVLSQYKQASVQVLSQYTQASVQVLSQYTQASVQVLSQYTQASVQVLSQYTQASVQVLSQYTQASVQKCATLLRRTREHMFRMHKMLQVALPQPAGITVYEYYAPENRCVKFYDVTERTSGTLPILCPTEVCNCAEANCPQLKSPEVPDGTVRITEACNKRDFAYKVTLKEIKSSRSTYSYTFTIVEVIKAGTDSVQPKEKRDFLTHSQCKNKLDVKVGKDYLIMGPEPVRIDEKYRYIMGTRTWVEYWPTSKESQDDINNNKERYNGLAELKYILTTFECTT
ncbi:hypothetical protein NFI96_024607, partial [Prochilodus magdalenae]